MKCLIQRIAAHLRVAIATLLWGDAQALVTIEIGTPARVIFATDLSFLVALNALLWLLRPQGDCATMGVLA